MNGNDVERDFLAWLDSESRKLNEKAARKRTGLLKTDIKRLSEIESARNFLESKAAYDGLKEEYRNITGKS